MKSVVICFLFALFCAMSASAGEPAPAAYTEPTTGMQFVLIPGGTFTMGDPSGKDEWARPAHEVSVESFYMGKFEVTFNEYTLFCEATGRPLPDDLGWGRGLRPVINVSWHDAVAFAEWLSKKTGKTFRLPTEAEWEYAARGGLTTNFPWGDGLGRGNATCRYCGNPWDGKSSSTIGSFSPNGFGLYDMAGNVYEWCLDTLHEDYVGAPADGSAWIAEPKYPGQRINRGGSWYQLPQELTVFRRCWDRADKRSFEYGIRLLMEP